MEAIKKLKIDILKKDVYPVVYAMQSDSYTRSVEMSFFADGVPWNLPTGSSVGLAFEKPDKTTGLYDTMPDGTAASSVSGSVVTIKIAPQVLTVPGTVYASVVILSQYSEKISSFPFVIDVAKNPSVSNVVSNNYWKYQSLADINAGFSNIENDIIALKAQTNISDDTQSISFEVGGLASTTGLPVANTARYRSDFIPISNFWDVSVLSQNYQVTLFAYNADKGYIDDLGEWKYSLNKKDAFKISEDVVYVRFLLRRSNGGNMVEADINASGVSLVTSRYLQIENNVAVLFDRVGEYPVFYQPGGISDGRENASTTRIRTDYIDMEAFSSVSVKNEAYQISWFAYTREKKYLGKLGEFVHEFSKDSILKSHPTAAYVRMILGADNEKVLNIEYDLPLARISFKFDGLSNLVEKTRKSVGLVEFNAMECGLPVLQMFGDTSAMTKDNAVPLDYKYGDRSGTLTCKWQGSSSVRLGYPKRNYTIKFDTAFEAKEGWGSEKKYCTKANWVDPSGARNVVSANLWAQVVKSRSAVNSKLAGAPNYGAIDGFPVVITINGEYTGLYTWNIPKDGWMFNMGSGSAEYLLAAEDNAKPACLFKGLAVIDETDYSIEYKPDGVEDSTIVTSFNRLLQAAIDAGSDWETTLAPYLDIDSVVDYFIFVNCIGGHDNLGKNILYGTYDGTKWFMSAYDLDTTYGSNPYGKEWFKVVNDRNQFKESAKMHKLAHLVYEYSKPRLKERYQQLRKTVLSDENVWWMFANFINQIPRGLYNLDATKWTTMPGTSMANLSTYMDFYRMHCAYLDKEIDSLED